MLIAMEMKRVTLFLMGLVCVLFCAAAEKNGVADAVSMVSYEQSWSDSEGTLALKNNTDEEIHNLHFMIVYTDMSGTQLDYEEFWRSVNIAPGKTKKIDIPAYEHDRYYSYYKSEEALGASGKRFKIEFELKDYNFEEEVMESVPSDNNGVSPFSHSSGKGAALIMLVILVFVALAWVGLYVCVAVMAKERNRSAAVWVLLSIIASPILMIIILFVIGKGNRYD